MVSKIVGTFLYYSLVVYSTMLVALSHLAATQSKSTEQTYDGVVWLLNYYANHPTAVVRYKHIKRILRVNRYASYLSVTKARSIAGGYNCLINDSEDPPDNGPIHNVYKIMTNVMSAEAEAKIGAYFINAQYAVPERTTLI